MDDKSQTDAPAPTGGDEPKPEVAESAPAEQSDEAPSGAKPTDTPDDLSGFAKSQGFSDEDLQNPAVQKALKVAKDNNASSVQNFQKSKQLEEKLKAIGDKSQVPVEKQEFDDPLEKKVAQLEESTKDQLWQASVGYFMAKHPDAVEMVDDMDSIAEEKPHLAQDLDTLYEIAKGRSTSTEALTAQAKAEERERLAKASQAAPAERNATTQEVSDDVMSIELIQKMGGDRQWYKKNKDRINTFLAQQ